MNKLLTYCLFAVIQVSVLVAEIDPLPSWNEGPAKQAIREFVQKTCDQSSQEYVAPANRIATFDQDGTLWVEHPLYTQGIFALDRVKAIASEHPEWKDLEPFKTIIAGNNDVAAQFTEQDWERIIAATHAGMSTDAFLELVRQWLATATHPRFKRPYTELTYQPMLEVMSYLRANSFKTYIVTGGGQEFVRVYSESVYGIPTEQIIGSTIATKYTYQKDKPLLMRLPKIFFIDDYAGKPININLFIGKRPYAAFGNSDGDKQMLEWTQAGQGPRLMMLICHDDAAREYAYGPANDLPNTSVGTFSGSLMNDAKKNGWIVISMKQDWKRIFSFDQ